ncbi:MAG: NUDIX domain-containing protein [Acidimicrobiia bacterium]|nr:NUDIX domain-containing protein [Acidimicrobiia bacterium]
MAGRRLLPVIISAGILPFRLPFQVLVAHPGGPYWAHKDAGSWSLIKGEVADGEKFLEAARREFTEETGWPAPTGPFIELGAVNLRSRKQVHAWAVEAEFDPAALDPGTFSIIWRGRSRHFPEIDRVRWADRDMAMSLLNPAQRPFVERLEALLD